MTVIEYFIVCTECGTPVSKTAITQSDQEWRQVQTETGRPLGRCQECDAKYKGYDWE